MYHSIPNYFKIAQKVCIVISLFTFLGSHAFALDFPRYRNVQTVGGTGIDFGVSVSTDGLGNTYLLGQFDSSSVDLDPTSGTNVFTSAGSYDTFLTKFNADGTYAWTRTWGGTGVDNAYALDFDSLNNVYVVIEFSSTVDFDFTSGVDNRTSAGGVDMALIKINVDGSYDNVKVMGGTGSDRPQIVKVDSLDNVYVAGKFRNTVDFDPGAGVDNHSSAGDYDAFLTKFNADGTYAWTRTWGNAFRGSVNDIALDSSNNIYLLGVFQGTVDFDPFAGTDNRTSNGGDDVVLTRFNADGTYAWTRVWGGASNDISTNIGISPSNAIYAAALFGGTVDFDPSVGVNNISSNGDSDISVSKFQSDGTYNFTYAWGGALVDEPYGLTFDSDGKWYVSGVVNGPIDLDPTSGTRTPSINGTYDHFFSVFNASDAYLVSKTFGSVSETDWFDEIVYEVHAAGSTLHITGGFVGTTDFNPEVGTDNRTSLGISNIYYATYSLANPGVTVSPTSGLITTEAGGTATTTVVLNAIPTDNVVVSFSSSNTGEGTVSPSSVTFTTVNWNTPQTITITGVDDAVVDGNIAYTLVTTGATSTDPGYVIAGASIPDVSITNTDNDTVPSVPLSGGIYRLGGCMDPLAINFDRYVTYQSGSCVYRDDTKPAVVSTSASSTSTPSIPTNTSGICERYIIGRHRIELGKQNDAEVVRKIQRYLNTYEQEGLAVDGVYKVDDVLAVKRFQQKYTSQILAPWGITAPSGIVGLTTIAKMNAVVCGSSSGCPYFTSPVKQGDSSPEVMRIKNFLNIVIGSELDIASPLFDTPTENAVRLFQNRYQRFILAPWGLTRGTGWWYQASVRQANKFIGCTNLPPVTLSNGTVLE